MAGGGTLPEQGPLRGVGQAALGMAVVRAAESRRADRLFDDPFAQAFVDAAPGAFPGRPEPGSRPGGSAAGATFYMNAIIRTRFFDHYLNVSAAGGCRQVGLVAAGLDTRAFRLAGRRRA
jgi:methyltransferase (TIGR00027 family)